MRHLTTAALIVALLSSASALGAPTITSPADNLAEYPDGKVPRYEKYELSFTVDGVGTAGSDYNPFNPNLAQLSNDYWNRQGILVDALLTSPSGKGITYPCFWYEGSDGWKGWKLRFAPTEEGTWKVRLRVRHASGEATAEEASFACGPSGNHGFLRINPADPRALQFADGTPFHPLGMGTEGYYAPGWIGKHEEILPKLHAQGGNFVRLMVADGFGPGCATSNIEPYGVSGVLNRYDMSAARCCDTTVDLLHQHEIHAQWMLDDWTHFKDETSPYISGSGDAAPVSSYEDCFDGVNRAREIYQRKLRYAAARWGYSTHLAAWEFINEYYGDDFEGVHEWHRQMGNTIKGTFRPDYLPAGHDMNLDAQPHLFTSSTGNYRVRPDSGVPWGDPAIDVLNYHSYSEVERWGGGVVDWTTVEAGGYEWEPLGSTLPAPWHDHAVLVDRTARIARQRWGWMKPYVWGEFGLGEWHPEQGKGSDWVDAYAADTQGRHQKDAIWAGAFAFAYPLQWKAAWMLGKEFNDTEKFWVFRPLASYVAGEDFAGLKQETCYPVADELNPSPGVRCDNANVMAMALRGPDRAYLYVKNATDVWYRIVDPGACPTPAGQSAVVTIGGLGPGTYSLEQWSTSEMDPAKQVLTTDTLTVGADGIATIHVEVGVGDGAYDVAYKLKSWAASDAGIPPAGDGGPAREAGVPPAADGGEGDDPPLAPGDGASGGCGCRTARGPAGAMLAGLALLAGLRLTRRRADRARSQRP